MRLLRLQILFPALLVLSGSAFAAPLDAATTPATTTPGQDTVAASPWGTWSGDMSFGLSFNSSSSLSRRTTADAELLLTRPDSDISFDLAFDRETVKVPGQQAELDRDKYDVNVKYRHTLWDADTFVYLSPRLRHNVYGYYVRTSALRAGLGHRWQTSRNLNLTLEGGTGYRHARLYNDGTATEVLFTVAGRARWQVSPGVQLRLSVVHEQSRQERYRTLDISLRSRLTDHVGLQVKASHSRGFPFSSIEPDGETELDVGVSYEF